MDLGLWSRKEPSKPKSADIDFNVIKSSPTDVWEGGWTVFKVICCLIRTTNGLVPL